MGKNLCNDKGNLANIKTLYTTLNFTLFFFVSLLF
jgi:hypothetical protein